MRQEIEPKVNYKMLNIIVIKKWNIQTLVQLCIRMKT